MEWKTLPKVLINLINEMKIFFLILLFFNLVSCGEGSADRVLNFYKDSECFELANAVYSGDVDIIESIVKKDTTKLSCYESTAGTSILTLAMYAEKYESLKKLLELGANPNSINRIDKQSVLIESIIPYGTQFEWNEHIEYSELLLKYGADPNYKIDFDFVNVKGRTISYCSPLEQAVTMNLDYVKLLLNYGADYNQTVNENPIFFFAINWGNFEIINYFIDSLEVDVFQVLDIYGSDTLYVQDCIFRFMDYVEDSERDKAKIKLIKKLEKMGVDFKKYK